MVRYFYAWAPLGIVGTIVLLAMPWFGLVALMILAFVALIALAALAFGVAFVPYMLIRAISRRWHTRSGARSGTALALSPARRESDSVWQGAPSYAAAVSGGRDLLAPQHVASPEDDPW